MLQLINNFIADTILFVADTAGDFWQNFNAAGYSSLQIIVDILLVAILFYWFIRLVAGSRAFNIILGLLVLAGLFLISRKFELTAVSWLLSRLFTVILVAIPVIFQQELMQGIERLGHTQFFMAQKMKEAEFLIGEIIGACLEMQKHRVGALIVFQRKVSLKEYVDSGVTLNAKLSKELLQSIFSKGASLHDGALVVDRGFVVAAGVTLPHSFKNYGHSFGTRHKAAISLSEVTDAKVIIISEEKGIVSLAEGGKIEMDVSAEDLQKFLTHIYSEGKARARR